jgi:hypothetical protein
MACLETKGCGRHDVYRPGLSYIFPEQGLFTYAIRLLFIYQHMHFAYMVYKDSLAMLPFAAIQLLHFSFWSITAASPRSVPEKNPSDRIHT